MKDIDLTGYSETDLIELNHRVIERIRVLRQDRFRSTITEFRVGDRVSFAPECGHEVVGTVVRLNRKSVTIVTTEGVQWRVAPVLLKKQESHYSESKSRPLDLVQGNLIDFAALTQRDRGQA